MQQLRAQLLGGLVPQLARALRQLHIAGSFGVSDAINAGAAGMAAAAMRRSELIEPTTEKPRLASSTAAKLPMVPSPMMATS